MSRRLSDSRALVTQPHSEPAAILRDDSSSLAGDPREILRILRRHLRIVVATTGILVAAAIVFTGFVTPLYTATSSVLVDPRRAMAAESNSQPAPTNFGTDDASIESQVLLVQSITVLQRVVDTLKLTQDPEFIARPGLFDSFKEFFTPKKTIPAGASPEAIARANAVERLQRRMKVTRQRTTFMVDINVSSEDPEKAALIANAVADSYLIEQVRSKYDATKIAAGWLDRQITDLKNRVATSDRAVADFRSANNLMVSQGVTVNDQQITDLNNKLVEARTEAAEARARFDQVQQIAQSGADPGSVAEALSSNIITQLRAQYAELTKNAADLSSRYGARHPLVAAVQAQVKDTQRLVADEVKRILQGRRHTYEVSAAREASLQQSLDKLQNVSTQSGQAQVRLRELQREADANRTLYESFLARFKEASAQESLELPEARIVTRADIPIRPSFPKTLLILAVAGGLGLGLGCVLAWLSDYLDPRVKTLEQAEAVTGVPAIAAVPLVGIRELAAMAKRGRRELGRYDPARTRLLPPPLQPPLMRYAVEQPMSLFTEGVRAVRLAIQQAARANGSRVVLVTSAMDGEGKTTLAANLALSFATIGVKTILVDGDLRNPELTGALCPRTTTGLLQVAAGEIPLHQAILLDQSTNLSILPAPAMQDMPMSADFASSAATETVLSDLRAHYDVIIVDASPLIPVVDGRVLAELADHIVLAMHWDRTQADLLRRAVELLDHVHDRIVGTVMTQVDIRRVRLYERYPDSVYMPYGPAVRTSAGAAE